MSGIATKWAIRRYQPALFSSAGYEGAMPHTPSGSHEQIYDSWRDVCIAADTILGTNHLQMGVEPTNPVVIRHGDDVVLIYMKLEM